MAGLKPYYEQDGITIYHSKAEAIFPLLEDGLAVLTIADIPYGKVNRESGGLRNLDKGDADDLSFPLAPWMNEVARVTKGSLYVWCGTEQVSELRGGFASMEMTTRLCVWEKTNPSPMNGEHLWLSGLEACVFARKSGAPFFEFCKVPRWTGPSAPANGHPTPKPEWLMGRLILASSAPGDVVLDPCCGSGTTLRVAKDTGRKAVGIEVNEAYCEIAAKRLAQGVLFGAGGAA